MTIVVTNAFFVESGLLTRQKEDQGFIPTPEALAYHKAWEWNPETAGHKLGDLFERTWFSEALIPRLKMRPHEDRDAKTVLAEACGASKDYEARVSLLLDYLEFAGLIVREGGMVKAVGSKRPEAAPTPKLATALTVAPAPVLEEGHDRYTLVLDPKTKRKVVIEAPHTVTSKELERIRAWLGVQLIIEDDATV